MKKHILFLSVLILLTVVLISQSHENVPLSNNLQLVEFDPTQENNTITTLQTLTDNVSQAALNGQWSTASLYVQRLENSWNRIKPRTSSDLNLVREIDYHIQNLHYNVWGRDPKGVLNTTSKITTKLAQILVELQQRE